MKKLTRIFFAVAALFAFACTTDATHDLGVNLENKTTLAIKFALEESRTHLGEKVDGVYPIYWSEGDAVSVNGVASAALTADQAGTTGALFTFAGELVRPYSVVYPAPASGVTAAEGLYPVTFPATQTYTEGTFANGTAPMYGYAEAPGEGEEAAPVQLKHLTGVLRLAVKGNKTLTSMSVVAEKGMIAGNFDVDCTSGALTAHDDASNTITVSFGEGLALSDTATPIYVAVPAGEYGIFTITLFTNESENNAMVTHFNSDNHPIKAGIVKEFGEVTFAPNLSAEPVSGELVIENEADLVKLAKLSENGLLGAVTAVKVAATLDMSNVAGWHGIDRFPAIPFDGGSDKGFEIKGLKAPLFLSVEGAEIKNIKLTEVDIVETKNIRFGSLVCLMNGGSLTNCSTSGKVDYNNDITGYSHLLFDSDNDSKCDDMCIGGLAGLLNGTIVSNCTNSVDIVITNFVASTAATCDVSAGGIAGSLFGVENAYASLSNCVNYGSITSNGTKGKIRPVFGGIVGYCEYANINNVTNGAEGANKGNITINTTLGNCTRTGCIVGSIRSSNIDTAVNYGNYKRTALNSYPYVGGIVGQIFDTSHDVLLQNIDNYGTMTVETSKETSGTPFVGGIAGRVSTKKLTMKKCNYHGAMNLKIYSTGDCKYGGIVGGGATSVIEECNNSGALILNGKGAAVYIGGVIGYYSTVTMTNCDNTGAITLNGECTNLYIGGVAGRVDASSPSFTYCDNNAPISFNLDAATGGYAGGVLGYIKTATTFTHNTNGENGDITFTGECSGNFGISGLGACVNMANSDCSNAGDILVTATNNTGTFYIGGHSWTGNKNITNFTNSGDMIFGGKVLTSSKYLFIYGAGYTPSATLTNVHNSGDIIITSDAVAPATQAGGLFRTLNAATLDNCSNSGDIIYEGTTLGETYLGGIASTIGDAAKFKGGFTNSGKVIYAGSSKSYYIGGFAGSISKAVTIDTDKPGNIVNTGEVTNYIVNKDGSYKVGTAVEAACIGGCFGQTKTAEQSATFVNSGAVNVRNAEGAYGTTILAGGIVGNATIKVSNAKSLCDIAFIGFTESATSPIVGVGLATGVHRGSAALVSNCQLGGRLATEEIDGVPSYKAIEADVLTYEEADGTMTEDTSVIPFFRKIYGGIWSSATASSCDDCTFINTL
jgi:hypothetical protein